MPNRKRLVSEADRAIGPRIRIARAEIGMSQDALARALGLTFQQVQKYEKGTNRVSAARLAAIAAILGKKMSYFVDGIDVAVASDDHIINRMLLSGNRGIELAKLFVGVDSGMQIKILDLVRGALDIRNEARATKKKAV